MGTPMKAVPGYVNERPGVQVAAKWQGAITKDSNGAFGFDADGVAFLKQMGVEWVMVNDPPAKTAAEMKRLREQIEDMGFKVFRMADNRLHNMKSVVLNLPDRDRWAEEYLEYISNLGEAGVYYSTYAHMGNGIWRGDARQIVRGGAVAGGLNLEAPNRGHWLGEVFEGPLSHGRRYEEEELWENYAYFIKKVVPVAESAGVYIGVHPDDPPAYELAGIPRRIFGTFEGYKRALEIADSPNIGACLCVGCWLEAGCAAGCSPEEFIDYFGGMGKLFKLHLRNVTGTLDSPGGFAETFPDAGYYDMAGVAAALVDVGFDGAIINDHLVETVGGHYACEAYFTAYLKGLFDALQSEKAALRR